MSGRPTITTRAPNRLTTQVPKTTKKTRVAKGGVQKKVKIEKSIIKDKKTLISYIEKKIGKASGKNRLAWITLNHIYSDYTDTQITTKFKKYSNADIDRYLNIQHDIINKLGSTLSNTLPSTLDIQMDDTKLINFLVMIWLDMAHDGTFSKKETFGNFLKSDYVKFLIKTPINGIKTTKTIEKLIDNHILINKDGNLYRHADADKNIKNNIHNIWGDGSGMYFLHSTSKIRSKIKKPKLPIYMSLDSEDSNLTELIKSSKIGNSYYIKPLINVANLLDPGRGGSSTGQRGGTMDRLTRQLFRNEPYIHYKFDVNTYAFNFGKHMSVNIYIDDTKFNISVNGVPLKMGTTTNEAKKGDTIQKISKFMGDFAQILVVAHQYKRGLRSVSGTLDGVFVGITAFVQKELLGMKPRIMFDNSTYGKNGIIIHGFDDLLIKNNTKTQSPSVVKYIKNMNANVGINQNTRATTQMLLSKPNTRSKSVSKGNAPSRNNTAGMNRAPTLRAAPSRNNTAEMKRPNSNVSQRKRLRPTTGSAGSSSERRVRQRVSPGNQSSAAKTNGSPNSITQSRSGTGKVESITRTKSPESVARTKSAKFESVTRTTSARPATSNSARSNQTRG